MRRIFCREYLKYIQKETIWNTYCVKYKETTANILPKSRESNADKLIIS